MLETNDYNSNIENIVEEVYTAVNFKHFKLCIVVRHDILRSGKMVSRTKLELVPFQHVIWSK